MFIANSSELNKHQQMVYAHASDNSLLERFELLLGLLGIERADFARLDGVSQQHVNTWLKRQKIGAAGIAHLRELARQKSVEGFTEDWLNHGIGPEPKRVAVAGDSPGSHAYALPQAGLGAAPYVRFEYLKGYSKERAAAVDIPQVLLANMGELLSPNVRAFICPGDTMRGVVEKGDLVFVDTAAQSVVADGIYVYKLAGIAQIRRFQIRGQGILRLQGTHSYEDSLELTGSEIDGLEIGGRVVGKVGFSAI